MAETLVTQAQNGGRLSVAAGDVLVVKLAENPTTGYRWQVESAGGLGLTQDDFAALSSAPGAGGERTFRFSTSAPGTAVIEASLRRAWEAGAAPQARFRVTVEVR